MTNFLDESSEFIKRNFTQGVGLSWGVTGSLASGKATVGVGYDALHGVNVTSEFSGIDPNVARGLNLLSDTVGLGKVYTDDQIKVFDKMDGAGIMLGRATEDFTYSSVPKKTGVEPYSNYSIGAGLLGGTLSIPHNSPGFELSAHVGPQLGLDLGYTTIRGGVNLGKPSEGFDALSSLMSSETKHAPPAPALDAPPNKPTLPTKAKLFSFPSVPGIPENSIVAGARKKALEMQGKAPPAQVKKQAKLEHGLGMITDPVNARKAVKSVFGTSVDADAYLGLDSTIDGVGRIGAVLNGPKLSPRQMSGTLKTTKQDGLVMGTAVGALVDRPTVDKLMRSAAYSNPQHPEHETVANTVRGYFDATTPKTTVTTPDNDPALWSGVQRETQRRQAAQAKVDAASQATQATKQKAEATAAAKPTANPYGPPTLAQYNAAKQATLGQAGLLQTKDDQAPVEIGKPQTFTLTSTHTINSRHAMQAPVRADGRSIRSRDPAKARPDKTGARPNSNSGNISGVANGNNNVYGYRADDPSTAKNEAGYATFGGWMRAVDKSIKTGWHGDPTKNPRDKTKSPTQTSGSTAGSASSRVICTELVRQGHMAPSLQRLDIAFTLKRLSPATVRGYHFWAVAYVRLMKRSKLATRLINPVATWRAEEIAYQLGERPSPRWLGKVVRLVMEPGCWALGMVLGQIGDPDRFHPQLRHKMSQTP